MSSADNVSSNAEVEACNDAVARCPDLKTWCGEVLSLAAIALLLYFFELVYNNLKNPLLLSFVIPLYVAMVVMACCMTSAIRANPETALTFWLFSLFFVGSGVCFLLIGPKRINDLAIIYKVLYPVPFLLMICADVIQMIRWEKNFQVGN